MSGTDGEVRLIALVRGRVQGVGFRYWVRALADDLGLRGSATNLPEGRVEIIAEGTAVACAQLLDALRSDRPPGWVGEIVETWSEPAGLPDRFIVR